MKALLQRLDRSLLLRYPVVWRTRVLPFLFFSCLIASAFYAVGSTMLLTTESVPTFSQISKGLTGLRLLGGLLLVTWAFFQIRVPLAEWCWRRYLVAGVCYTVCVFSVLTAPLALLIPLVHRIADVVPDAEFEREYEVHAVYDFWCCNKDISPQSVAIHEKEIRGSLARYGLSSDMTVLFASSACGLGGPLPCLAVTNVRGNRAPLRLGGTFRSVRAAKDFRRNDGEYFERFISSLPCIAMLSLFLALLIAVAGLPRHTLRRWVESGMKVLPVELKLSRPILDSSPGRYFVSRQPLLWSTQTHVFLFWLVLYCGVSVLLSSRLATPLYSSVNYSLFTFALFGVLLPGTWAYRRRTIPLDAKSLAGDFIAVVAYFAVGPVLSGIGVAFWMKGYKFYSKIDLFNSPFSDAEDFLTCVFVFFTIAGSCSIVGLVYLWECVSVRHMVIASLASFTTFVGSIVSVAGKYWFPLVLGPLVWLMFAARILWVRNRRFLQDDGLLACSCFVMLTPWVFLLEAFAYWYKYNNRGRDLLWEVQAIAVLLIVVFTSLVSRPLRDVYYRPAES